MCLRGLRARLRARRGSVEDAFKGAFDGALRARRGHIEGVRLRASRDTLEGVFEAHLRVLIGGSRPTSTGRGPVETQMGQKPDLETQFSRGIRARPFTRCIFTM